MPEKMWGLRIGRRIKRKMKTSKAQVNKGETREK